MIAFWMHNMQIRLILMCSVMGALDFPQQFTFITTTIIILMIIIVIIIHYLKFNIQEVQCTIQLLKRYHYNLSIKDWWTIDNFSMIQLIVIIFKEECLKFGLKCIFEIQLKTINEIRHWCRSKISNKCKNTVIRRTGISRTGISRTGISSNYSKPKCYLKY